MATKKYIDKSVLSASKDRISTIFDSFEKYYISFSGGKDSTVMTHLVMEEAIKRGKKVGLLIIDLEAQYHHTISHIREIVTQYKDHIDFINYAKMIFSSNELPPISDLSDGFWLRWILIPFPYQFLPKKEINDLPEDKKEFVSIEPTEEPKTL